MNWTIVFSKTFASTTLLARISERNPMRRTCMTFLRILTLVALSAAPALAATWSATGPEGGAIRSVLVDPSTPGTIHGGTAVHGIFQSTDAGATATQTDPPGPAATSTIRSLVFGAAGTVYAASDNSVSSTSGVFQSTNGGISWTSIGTAANNL